MTRESIITELQRRGYDVEAKTTIKNGVELAGIVFKSEKNISPLIYTDEIIKAAEEAGKALDDIAEDLIKIYKTHTRPDLDLSKIMTLDYFKKALRIGVQRAGSENIVRANCEDFAGIEKYLYVKLNDFSADDIASFKVKPEHLEMIGLTESEAWKYAEQNTFAESRLLNMADALKELTGEDMPGCFASPLWIITNANKNRGAAAILNRDLLKDFAKNNHVYQLIILPSSIHECILMPYDENFKIDELTQMILDVNTAEVNPVDQLGDRPYIVTL